jgi:hypothetical protein
MLILDIGLFSSNMQETLKRNALGSKGCCVSTLILSFLEFAGKTDLLSAR